MKQTEEYLLENACPSIKYRVKKEVQNEMNLYEEERLQNQILEDEAVRELLNRQNEDGWIDEDFHSDRGIETVIRLLSEKGVSRNHQSVQRMLEELEKRKATFDRGCLLNVGKVLDEKGLGGSELIRATIFAYAGVENKPFIKKQIQSSLNSFKFVINVEKISDVVKQYKNKKVFKNGVKWPSIYNLRLLAFTKGWRNKENQKIAINSINRLIKLSPIPDIHVLNKSQLISPASFCMHNFKPNMKDLKDKQWMIWFHRMELLSRLGVVNHIEELKKQVYFLAESLRESNGIFKKRVSHYYFTKWGPYTGLTLERDWKSKKRRMCDLTFRCLLILHYSQKETY